MTGMSESSQQSSNLKDEGYISTIISNVVITSTSVKVGSSWRFLS
ncbi:hypothetical protein ACK3F5_03755 [Photorhabdus asymbiotica UENP]|nr:hypothetical protein [Photorhabdus asymbiotica]